MVGGWKVATYISESIIEDIINWIQKALAHIGGYLYNIGKNPGSG